MCLVKCLSATNGVGKLENNERLTKTLLVLVFLWFLWVVDDMPALSSKAALLPNNRRETVVVILKDKNKLRPLSPFTGKK